MHRLLLSAIILGALATPAPAVAQLRIDLNIPALKLVVWDGDEILETYPVAVGMPGFDTPTGEFAITHAEWNPWWNPPTHREWARNDVRTPPGPNNPMGRVKLFFLPLYFIHGTPDGQSIGTPASHGCVRMRNADVIELSRLLHQKAAPQLSAAELERLAARPGATRRVNFQESIPVRVRYEPVVVERDEIYVHPDIYGRNAIHTESVYQALMSAGFDTAEIDPADIRRFVDRARGQKVPVVTRVDEAFGRGVKLLAG